MTTLTYRTTKKKFICICLLCSISQWCQNNFLTGNNTLYFTRLCKNMHNEAKAGHLK